MTTTFPRFRSAILAAGLAANTIAFATSGPEASFARKAASGGMAEVEMGKLGQDKGTRDSVKQFGARMVADHGKANEELEGIASAKGVSLPSEPDAKAKGDVRAMAGMSGPGFDKHYMDHMVADHHKDIALFEREAKSGKDREFKAFAEKTLPTLKDHLQMAKQIQASIK